MTKTPDWLRLALREAESRAVPLADGARCERRPRPGDLCVARAADLSVDARLLVVLGVDDETLTVVGALVSNLTEAASDKDLVLDSNECHLPFSIMIHADIVAPLWWSQLDGAIGRLGPKVLALLNQATPLGQRDYPLARRGLPIAGKSDPRWAFKQGEVDALHRLAASCAAFLASDASDSPSIVDPHFLKHCLQLWPADAMPIMSLCAGLLPNTLPVPEEILNEALAHEPVDVDIWAALEPILQICSGRATQRSELSPEGTWSVVPRHEVAAKELGATLDALGREGRSGVNLIGPSSDAAPSVLPPTRTFIRFQTREGVTVHVRPRLVEVAG